MVNHPNRSEQTIDVPLTKAEIEMLIDGLGWLANECELSRADQTRRTVLLKKLDRL